MMLTLLGFLSKLKLATVADDDRNPRAVFLVCRNVHDLRDDVFVAADHPAEHHVFAWVEVEDLISNPGRQKTPKRGEARRMGTRMVNIQASSRRKRGE